MDPKRPGVIELFADLKRIAARIPADLGGGCPLSKSFLMAHLALEFGLKTYVEIGVYRGRSFFPMAYASRLLGGFAYGIDAYDYEAAREHDLGAERGRQINRFLESLDFGRMHADANALLGELGFAGSAEIIRERSSVAAGILKERKVAIDLLHIDGNHDTRIVSEDIEAYVPLVKDGGFVVMDDVDWASVRPAFTVLKQKLDIVFNDGRFAILAKAIRVARISALERQRLQILHSMVENAEVSEAAARAGEPGAGAGSARVSVIVLSYNQATFIAECLEGILAQKGDFRVELVIGDDCSTDATLEVVGTYLANLGRDNIDVKVLSTERNLGIPRNLERCLKACTGQYIAICEGDDYWIDCHKLQAQMDFLRNHPACAMCFNDIHIDSQESGEFSAFETEQRMAADVLTTKDVVRDYLIGNYSCCMYDARYVPSLPAGLFDLTLGDWMFNICYSAFGDIGHVRRKMSVYRKHRDGVWAGKPPLENAKLLHSYIDEYNRFLNYDLDVEFSTRQKRLEAEWPDEFHRRAWDIAIIDDVFPHPLSAFRVQEFEGYLAEFDSVKIYASGLSVRILGKETREELVAEFKRRRPEYAKQLEVLEADTVINARLIYTVFLGNAYSNIERIEDLGTPFVFTLYPGGQFGLDNAASDMMLKRVTSSPCFRKVIVTQQVTYDYLLRKRFCAPDQIEFVFGLVTPNDGIGFKEADKRHFGIDKDVLDICFVGHKYVARGVDKGYDIFVEVARDLCRRYDDIQFHVVGSFDENEIDVTDIRERFTFYGTRHIAWFDEFYRDKDIILSPNVPSKIFEGSFDGFPTGACVDAALRTTAIFAADELHLNTHFVDGVDLVIVPHDAARAAGIIEKYYRDPAGLKAIAENGCRTARRLYSYGAQMAPRISSLQAELERARSRAPRRVGPFIAATALKMSVRLWRRSPRWLQERVGSAASAIRSHEALFALIKRTCPRSVIRLYRKFQASAARR